MWRGGSNILSLALSYPESSGFLVRGWSPVSLGTRLHVRVQKLPRPQGLLLVQNGGRRNPWPRLPKWLKKFVRISSRKDDEMSLFCLNNGFQLQKKNRAARRWEQPPKKPFYHVSRDRMLHNSWSISAALAWGFSAAILNEEKALGMRLGAKANWAIQNIIP